MMIPTEPFVAAAERLRRATVQVRTQGGGGAGVIWTSDGLIITNAHVVRNRQPTVELADGRVTDAEIEEINARRDLAALRVPIGNLEAATIGDSDAIRVGQLVVAVGHPIGLPGAASTGVIHAVDRQGEWLQADIRLAPGNSGGPLADTRGLVLGINSMVAGGLGLAVPSNAVRRFLIGRRDRLGVTVQPVMVPDQAGKSSSNPTSGGEMGLIVSDVASGSVAERTGILLGDILMAADGRAFAQPSDLGMPDFASHPVVLEISRGGQRVSLTVSATPDANAEAA